MNATGVTQIIEAKGRVSTCSGDNEYLGAERGTNMTGELTGIYKALQEFQNTVPRGARVLLRYDCIPALMLASGIWKTHLNKALVEAVHDLWRVVLQKYEVFCMHAKGHSRIFGNTRADALADKGAELALELYEYRTVDELGGPVRFAEKYTPGDCGRECDLEKKYVGKKRARRVTKLHETRRAERHWKAIEGHLRHIGLAEVDQVPE